MREARSIAAVALCALAGCSDPPPPTAAACGAGDPVEGRPLVIATTVAPITDIVANVAAGSGARITGVVPEGTNSHTFEPAPSVAATLEDADVVFVNGLSLEVPTVEMANANMRDGAELCELGTTILPVEDYRYDFSFPEAGGKPNPHLWTNPPMARSYAALVRDVLAARDPSNTDLYDANFERFAAQIDELDAAVRAATETIPPGDRLLVTYHDAYAYFAEEYGWTVVGAVQPSSFDEPTPRELAALIDQIRERDVGAVFGSEVFPSPVLAQIAAETGAEYVDDLRDDDLPGGPGDADHSWLALMTFNYATMIDALGGDASAIEDLRFARPAVDDSVTYPQ